MPLNNDLHELLLILERAHADGGEWVHIDALRHLSEKEIEHAVRDQWVKQKGFGNLREFKIQPAGYSALGSNAELTLKQLRADSDAYIESLDAPDQRGAIRSLIQPLGEPLVIHVNPPADVKLCCEPGCNEPRHLTYNRCKPHQQAVWREREARNRGAVAPKRRTPAQSATQPHIQIVEPPIADDDTQPDLPVNTPPVPASPLTRAFARAAVRFILIAKGG